MKRFCKHLLSLAVCMVTTASLSASAQTQGHIQVIATTTHLSAIIQEIGGDRVAVTTLIPGGMCPGHFDIAPAMAQKIADADMFFSHEWEQWVGGILASAGSTRLKKAVLTTKGNLMVPGNNVKAAHEVAVVFGVMDPAGAERYAGNAAAYEARILSETHVLHNKFRGKKAVCSLHQEELLAWLGFTILAAYGRQEDMNLKSMAVIMKAAKSGHADIVVDNIQSGANAGLQTARDVRIPHVSLTNFPQDGSYLETLRRNVRQLEQALK